MSEQFCIWAVVHGLKLILKADTVISLSQRFRFPEFSEFHHLRDPF